MTALHRGRRLLRVGHSTACMHGILLLTPLCVIRCIRLFTCFTCVTLLALAEHSCCLADQLLCFPLIRHRCFTCFDYFLTRPCRARQWCICHGGSSCLMACVCALCAISFRSQFEGCCVGCVARGGSLTACRQFACIA